MLRKKHVPVKAARRRFVGGMAALALLAGKRSRAQDATEARVTVAYGDPGRPIPPDFLGLSYESAALVHGRYFSPFNISIIELIRALGRSGVIRIGGNTSERTVWHPQGEPASPESLAINRLDIDHLAGALGGWKLIYGLNLARGTPQEAADEAAYVARVAGDKLLAFQIGNEPDGFGRWTGVRPPTYDVAAYLAEWRKFHAAVQARVPNAQFAGPDVAAASDWVAAFAEARPEGLALLTSHYYAEGPAGSAEVTLPKLLQSDQQAGTMLEGLARTANAFGLPFRIAEANSVYNEGQPGVSDTLGSALWGLEFLFQAARAGAAGVNFHGGVHNSRPAEDKAYSPIARARGGGYQARPLYYGMLMFAQAPPGALVPVQMEGESGDLRAFAVRASDAALRLYLINKHPTRSARMRVDLRHKFIFDVSALRLTGPDLNATTGLTLGGASVDMLRRGAPVTLERIPSADEIVVEMPAASAALVNFPGAIP
jgi:hypothetical protein